MTPRNPLPPLPAPRVGAGAAAETDRAEIRRPGVRVRTLDGPAGDAPALAAEPT